VRGNHGQQAHNARQNLQRFHCGSLGGEGNQQVRDQQVREEKLCCGKAGLSPLSLSLRSPLSLQKTGGGRVQSLFEKLFRQATEEEDESHDGCAWLWLRCLLLA
jgi:hypothetical protein